MPLIKRKQLAAWALLLLAGPGRAAAPEAASSTEAPRTVRVTGH